MYLEFLPSRTWSSLSGALILFRLPQSPSPRNPMRDAKSEEGNNSMLKFIMAATALIALSLAPAVAGGPGHMPSFKATAGEGGGGVTTGTQAGGQGSSTTGAYGKAGQLNGSTATANGHAGGGASLKGASGGGECADQHVVGRWRLLHWKRIRRELDLRQRLGWAGGGGSLSHGGGFGGMPSD